MEAHMSPGLLALGPGIFSVRGVTTTRLTLEIQKPDISANVDNKDVFTHGSFSWAMAKADETTAAAPPEQHHGELQK